MSDNSKTAIWDRLGRTDPAHTKSFKRSGGFGGTAIKPMWSFRRMTEEFGTCGKGWGVGKPDFQVVAGPEGEVLVFCTASIWWLEADAMGPPCGDNPIHTVYGVGGDKAVGKNKFGLVTDDEAFKKAFTDAVTNALKLIGVGADVHMGLFDDNKYVNAIRDDFKANRVPDVVPDVQKHVETKYGEVDPSWRGDHRASVASTNRSGKFEDFKIELLETDSIVSLRHFQNEWRSIAKRDGWADSVLSAARELIAQQEAAILDSLSTEALADVPLKTALQGSVLLAGE
jgi:hypothetical protein